MEKITIILNYKNKQQELNFRGNVTHIQFDKGITYDGTVQIFIDNVDDVDKYERVK